MRCKDTDSDIKTLISAGRLLAFQKATAPGSSLALPLTERLGIGPFPLGLLMQGFYLHPLLSDSASPKFPRWEELRGKAGLGRGCREHAHTDRHDASSDFAEEERQVQKSQDT